MKNIARLADGRNTVIKRNAVNSDIINTINRSFGKAVEQTKFIAESFRGDTQAESARNVWNYLRTRVRYKRDPINNQDIRLPARLVADGEGDCKSFSLYGAGIMANLGYPVTLRYVSYDAFDPVPTHVYTVSGPVIVDGVYIKPNVELSYKHKYDYPMNVRVLSGSENLRMLPAVARVRAPEYHEQLLSVYDKVKGDPFHANLIRNEFLRHKGDAPKRKYTHAQRAHYLHQLRSRIATHKGRGLIHGLMKHELNSLQGGSFSGCINGIDDEIGKIRFGKWLKKNVKSAFKDVKKVAKKVAKAINPLNLLKAVKAAGLFVPRKAFLALVAVNARGLAKRLSVLSEDEKRSFWVNKFGGQLSVLNHAISRGKNKKPLLGAGKKVRQIKGIGAVVVTDEELNGIGEPVTFATVAALLTAAAPILIVALTLLKRKRVPEPDGSNLESEVPNTGNTLLDSVTDFAHNALETLTNGGPMPPLPNFGGNPTVENALPGSEEETAGEGPGSSFTASPGLMLGLAAAAGLLIYSQSK